MWNAQRRGFSSCTATCSLLFARRENATQEKNVIDQGPIFARPTVVLQSANQMWRCPEICWNNRSPQTDAQEVVWGVGRDSPSTFTQVSVHANIWGGIWGVICIESGVVGRRVLVAPSGETRKSREEGTAWFWFDELWEFPAQLVKRWVRNERSTYIFVVSRPETYLNVIHPVQHSPSETL